MDIIRKSTGFPHETASAIHSEECGNEIVSESGTPVFIRTLNVVGLLLLVCLLVPTTVVRPEQLMIVVPVLVVVVGIYWKYQDSPTITRLFFSLTLSLVLWIVLCENIVYVDNLLGSHVTADLNLGMQLQDYAKRNLKNQNQYRQNCCGDPLSFHYKPGTLYKRTYDCPQCSEPYEVVVDGTGYLNRGQDFDNGKNINMFVAGDSVLQGYGTPSIVEFLNRLLPLRIWNLSVTRYGPRQKVNALLTYALPQHPQWIIIEFYAGNDINDSVINESCIGARSYYCVFNPSERHRRVMQHPLFSSMVDNSKISRGVFDDYVERDFTLAVTAHLVSNFKGTVVKALNRTQTSTAVAGEGKGTNLNSEQETRLPLKKITFPGYADFNLYRERELDWLRAGMQLTHNQYDRLAKDMGRMDDPPAVILMYNPSAYEIYRDVMVDRDEQADSISEFQRKELNDYAIKNGWIFLDLTPSLNAEIAQSGVWLYGKSDTIHWSARGGEVVASVLARELKKLPGMLEQPKGAM